MPISDDTAALVAAQLTTAYAARLSSRAPGAQVQDEMPRVYQQFLGKVRAIHGLSSGS